MKISFENTTLEFDDELVREYEVTTCDDFERHVHSRLLTLRKAHSNASIGNIQKMISDGIKREIAIFKGELSVCKY